MKRTLLISSSLKITSALAITAMFGSAAFAGPDNPKLKTEETEAKSERVIVEESPAVDASVMPNEAASENVKSAEEIAASWSLDTPKSDAIELPEAEGEAITAEDGDIVIDSPDAVIISNPDAVTEPEDSTEDTAAEPDE